VSFRVVAANPQPDLRTICRFRAEQEAAQERLFVQALRLCWEAGLVKLRVVALDGTKVAANAPWKRTGAKMPLRKRCGGCWRRPRE
jgi:transposase